MRNPVIRIVFALCLAANACRDSYAERADDAGTSNELVSDGGLDCDSCDDGGNAGRRLNEGESCSDDLECLSRHCLDGTCGVLEIGSDCSYPAECESGFCVDGACCDSACDGYCQTCDGEFTDNLAGECGPIYEGTDPYGECSRRSSASCLTGYCDGDGDCEKLAAGSSCDDGVFCNGPDACDAYGRCYLHSGDPCAAGQVCNECSEWEKTCLASGLLQCDDDGDLMTVQWCDTAGSCVGSGESYCDAYPCWPVSPTGQTLCYNNSGHMGACPAFPCEEGGGPDYCGQDAQYPDSDRARSFIESTVDGDVVVTDPSTGLVWQKTIPESPPETRQAAIAYCEALTCAGRSDWRLPDLFELSTLVDFGTFDPASRFPDMPSSTFWSSSYVEYLSYSGTSNPIDQPPIEVRHNGAVDFLHGNRVGYGDEYAVRCVRAGLSFESNAERFQLLGENEERFVLDRAVGLFWERSYGRATLRSWKDALAYCEGFSRGGFDDWRLPDVNELISCTAVVASSGEQNPLPACHLASWSSTSAAGDADKAWSVVLIGEYQDVMLGFHSIAKTEERLAVCVRDAL